MSRLVSSQEPSGVAFLGRGPQGVHTLLSGVAAAWGQRSTSLSTHATGTVPEKDTHVTPTLHTAPTVLTPHAVSEPKNKTKTFTEKSVRSTARV